MTTASPKTSSRLMRAAAAEWAELDRHRERLLARRDDLRAELERVEAALVDLEERVALLGRLAPDAEVRRLREVRDAEGGRSGVRLREVHDDVDETPPSGILLRGTRIRETAVRVLIESPHGDSPIHYRRWLELLYESGYAVVGKDPAAVLLTQISRSPVVRKATASGMYELDREAPERLRRHLADLQARLRSLTSAPADPPSLARTRAEREKTLLEIAHVERAIEEAARSLGTDTGADVAPLAAVGAQA